MICETYKGRKLKAIKGKSYANSRISVNGTDCGEWFGTQADVIEWAKRTIDDVDSRPFEGRWSECWYAPGTYELNEIGHITAPGGTCSCDLCKTEPWNSCQNITAGGVCVCDHCMKPHRAAPNETALTQTEGSAEAIAETAEASNAEDDYDLCAYCGWAGKLRKDRTIRKHRERADSGRIGSTGSLPQDPHAPICKGTGTEPWKIDPLPNGYEGIRLNEHGGFIRDPQKPA